MKTVDLHVHSNYSDGTFSPEELVKLAVRQGLSAFALTDHDTASGVDPAVEYAGQISDSLQVIPGIEISAEYQKKEIHIVGLFIDQHNKRLIHTMQQFVDRRLHRNEEMVERFQKAGITVVTRAHFARYLIAHNIVKDTKEAFDKYLNEDSPYYVPRVKISALDGIELIRQSGGIPILAHPLHYHMPENELRAMTALFKENGLVGIEVKYSNHTAQDEAFVKRLANEFDLLPSGGSDFHGKNKPDILLGTGRGNLSIPYEYLEQFYAYRA